MLLLPALLPACWGEEANAARAAAKALVAIGAKATTSALTCCASTHLAASALRPAARLERCPG
eukprot:11498748-Alexandrium_andersonii.AAC.1